MNMLRAVMAGLCVVSLCAGAAQAKPSVHPVGTLRYDPAKCWNSYVILANEGGSGGSAKLIDRNGNLVHEWDQKGGQGFPNKVYPGGYLLTSLYPGLSTGFQDCNTVALLDFDGNLVRKFSKLQKVEKGEPGQPAEADGTYWVSRQHHDFQLEGSSVGYYAPGVESSLRRDGRMLVLAHENVRAPKINLQQLIDDVELLGAGREFDLEEVRAGRLSPVFFGSALTNFGVEPFLEEFLRMTPSPLPREADCGVIDTFSPDFSAFVFKIQANMNKAHRDRLAFMRICSGQFQRDAEYYHVQTGKKMRLSQPQQLMASEREIVDEAYAGDIIGVFDPGIFSIGDTICTPGKKFKFGGIPTFAPEHFSRVSPKDSMKRKQFIKGTEQIAQEGAIQIFKLPNSGMEEVIVGVVGTLQFDVFQYRMKGEYGVDLRMEGLPYEYLRFIDKAPVADLKDLNLSSDVELLEDYKGRSLLVFASNWSIDYTIKRNPGLELSETAQNW